MNEARIEVWRSSPQHTAVVSTRSLAVLHTIFRGKINIVSGRDGRLVIYADDSAMRYLLRLFCINKFNRLQPEHVYLSEVL